MDKIKEVLLVFITFHIILVEFLAIESYSLDQVWFGLTACQVLTAWKSAQCERLHWIPLQAKLLRQIYRSVFSRTRAGSMRQISRCVKICRVWIEVYISYVRLGHAGNHAVCFFTHAWNPVLCERGLRLITQNLYIIMSQFHVKGTLRYYSWNSLRKWNYCMLRTLQKKVYIFKLI